LDFRRSLWCSTGGATVAPPQKVKGEIISPFKKPWIFGDRAGGFTGGSTVLPPKTVK
jgi:hypothetical protein